MKRTNATSLALVACLVLATGLLGTGTVASTVGQTAVDERATGSVGAATTQNDSAVAGETLAADHRDALADAESYTLEWSTSVSGDDSVETRIDRTASVDAETGEQLLRSEYEDGSERTYVTADGDRYARAELGDDAVEYYRPSERALAASWNDGVEAALASFDFEAAGTTTADGERVQVYVGTDDRTFQWDSSWAWHDGVNVTRSDARVEVAPSGVVTAFTYNATVEVDGETWTQTRRFSYRGLNDTTVEDPSWLDEAEESVGDRTRWDDWWTDDDAGDEWWDDAESDDERETEDDTATDDEWWADDENESGSWNWTNGEAASDSSLGVSVTVVGSDAGVASLEPADESTLDSTDATGVSEAVRVTTEGDVEYASLELGYDESAVPSSGEDSLSVYRYDGSEDRFVAVDTYVDPTTGVAYAEVGGEGTYVVLYEETGDAS